ncbi:MAG: GldG family protein [Defluviitaleaceae bacterium]|nr:GldG family protein [Defluviitaleaceae bacterium]
MAIIDKRFRYGTFSTVMVLLAVIIFIFANLLAGEFDRSFDLTRQQIFSLSPQSREFLAELEQDITITRIAGAGQELPGTLANISRITAQLLDEYAAASSRIRVETRDPLLNPALIRRFAEKADIEGGIPDHSVLIESATGIRVIEPQNMVDFDVNPFTGAVTQIKSYNIEREITRAIHSTTQGATAVVYYVTGSGEASLPSQLIAFLESENFMIREINLVLEEIPADADILFISMPVRDWTEPKAERVLAFLEAEGSAFFALDLAPVATPNLANILDAYGISIADYLIFEDNPQNIFSGRTFFHIVPNIMQHEITENIFARNFANLVPFFPAEMRINPVRRTTLEIEPLWFTSQESFSRYLDEEAETLSRIPTDTPGPFPLALAVTERIFIAGTAYYTRIVAVNNREFYNPNYTMYIGEGNWHFVLNSLLWLQDQPPAIFIPARTPPGQMPLLITGRATTLIGSVAMFGIPLGFFGAGLFVRLRRKYN